MRNLLKCTDELICEAEIVTHESEQTYDYQVGSEGGINWEIGIDIYILLYIIYIRTYCIA